MKRIIKIGLLMIARSIVFCNNYVAEGSLPQEQHCETVLASCDGVIAGYILVCGDNQDEFNINVIEAMEVMCGG